MRLSFNNCPLPPQLLADPHGVALGLAYFPERFTFTSFLSFFRLDAGQSLFDAILGIDGFQYQARDK